jgi:hypothetical protein
MNPTAIEVLKTVFICDDCKKEHFEQKRAESCCSCHVCGKAAPMGAGGRGADWNRTCAVCVVKEEREAHQRDLANARSSVKRAEDKLAEERERLDRAERAMTAFNEKHPPRKAAARAQRAALAALAASTSGDDAIGGQK